MKILKTTLLTMCFLFAILSISCTNQKKNNTSKNNLSSLGRLQVSKRNPHLLETANGAPVFLNNYTSWKIIKNSSREDIVDFIDTLKNQKFNMISVSLLTSNEKIPYIIDTSYYGTLPFQYDSLGNPDPLSPIITSGNNLHIKGEYDYWDHANYFLDIASKNGFYVCVHPAWGKWVSGQYNGPQPGDDIVFNETNAYKYGAWLGKRYGNRNNIIWMLGGDRSAQYKVNDSLFNFCNVWNAMAEGIADGKNGELKHDGEADYSNLLMSYHPRKWAPNSSKWFHKTKWLSFNSIQDTPYDQIESIFNDYTLIPIKPTWLFEGRYEGATSAWAVRYQAYQTVIGGGFGTTYGNEIWDFPANWKEIINLKGSTQMKYLYTVVRDIWTDSQFLERVPDQTLIVGEQGDTVGDGNTIGDGDGGGTNASKKPSATSNRITAMRGKNGDWAIIYSANGRDITLDLSLLKPKLMSAYWFNPRNGMWNANDTELDAITPFATEINTEKGIQKFNPPGIPEPNNDWILILR